MRFSVGVSASSTAEETYFDVNVLLLVQEGLADLMPVTIAEEKMFMPPAMSYADAKMWAARVLQNIAARLESDVAEGSGLGRAELMLKLREPK